MKAKNRALAALLLSTFSTILGAVALSGVLGLFNAVVEIRRADAAPALDESSSPNPESIVESGLLSELDTLIGEQSAESEGRTRRSLRAAADIEPVKERLANLERVQQLHHELLSEDWEFPEQFAAKRRDNLLVVVGETVDSAGRRVCEVLPVASDEDFATAIERSEQLANAAAAANRAEADRAQSEIELAEARAERARARAENSEFGEFLDITEGGRAEMAANGKLAVTVRDVDLERHAVCFAFSSPEKSVEPWMRVGEQRTIVLDERRFVVTLIEGFKYSSFTIHVRDLSAPGGAR